MRYIAAVPAGGLIAGTAFGLLVPAVPHSTGYTLLILCGALAVWAWWTLRPRALAAAVACAFFAGGALLAADAWQRAWRPPLRVAFEDLARAPNARKPRLKDVVFPKTTRRLRSSKARCAPMPHPRT